MEEALSADVLSTEKIGKIAHKLLPIATMLKIEHIEELKTLSPEHIQEMKAEKIREYLQVIIIDLQNILGEI